MSTTTSLEQAQKHAEAVRAALLLANGNASALESLALCPLISMARDLDTKIMAVLCAQAADRGSRP